MCASRVVFLGGIWLPEKESEIISNSKGSVQSAANVLQCSIIKGLDKNLDEPVTIINTVFIGAFPLNYKRALIHSELFSHSVKDHTDYEVGFINLPLIKHYSRYISSKKWIKKFCMEHLEDDIFFIGYSMSFSIVKSLLYAKSLSQNNKTCLIVPDLPEYMNMGGRRGFFFSVIKDKSTKYLYQAINKIDSFVLLTNEMYSRLNVNAPYIVVEGVVDETVAYTGYVAEEGFKRIVYTGSLSSKYGVCDLVNAFCAIDRTDIRLVLCGSGDAEDYIRNCACKDERICYLGVVSNEKARELQNSAWLLVNPRNSSGEYTKYSFPSKTLEYMMSGRPILMYKLPGVPQEYDKFLNYINADIKTALLNLLEVPYKELQLKAKQGQEYVLTHKNSYSQAKRILSLFKFSTE